MKTLSIFTFLLLLSTSLIFSQVSINIDGSGPDNSAMLDVKSASKGFLLPRMTAYQQQTIDDPATGLIVFNIDLLDIYVYTGSFWVSVLKCDDKDTIYPWSCGDTIPVNHESGDVAPVTKNVTYGTVKNIPGETAKCWITSNLGADHQATAVNDATEASAGWYWQFNRQQGYKHDGTNRTPNTTWITSIVENLDWQDTCDPCKHELGMEWRIPTRTEWENVDAGGAWNNWNGSWNAALKLHAAGYLTSADGSPVYRGTEGNYWSSKQYDTGNGWHLFFDSGNSSMSMNLKTWGFSVRCLRE